MDSCGIGDNGRLNQSKRQFGSPEFDSGGRAAHSFAFNNVVEELKMDNSKVLPGYYKYQYTDSKTVYVLRNPKVNVYSQVDGLSSHYSVDNGKTWIQYDGFFPLHVCNYFRKLKRKPR